MHAVDVKIIIGDDFGREMRAIAQQGRAGTLRPRRILMFPTFSAVFSVITQKRLELLRAIRKHNPASVYGLAKIVNRDLKSVNVDLNVLVKNRLVTLERSSQGRKCVKPHVDMSQIEITV